MDPIHIDFTIPNQSLYIGFGLLIFAITLYLAISKNWEWLKNRPNPLPWMAEHYVALLLPLGFFAIGLAIYYWIWDIRGEIGRLVALLSNQTTPEDIRNLAYAIAALLGAVALSATIPFQLIKVWVNERLAKTAEQGHMTDRITKAVEQLGAEKTIWDDGKQNTAPNIEVRLGAIYALERIAQDSLRDHIPVMEILCAYVRHNAPAEDAADIKVDYEGKDWREEQEIALNAIPIPPIDIQTILSVIGRRKTKHIKFERDASANKLNHLYRLDLSNTNMQKLDLSGLNLKNALLEGVIMQEANLIGAEMQKANLYEAEMQGANFIGTDMQRAELNEAKMQGAYLIMTKMQGANLSNANMQGAFLNGPKFDQSTNLTACVFTSAAVRLVDFSAITTFTDDQVKLVFGDCSTILPKGITPPAWAEWAPSEIEFFKNWYTANL
ncbi:MAG: hypothetical protein GQ535_15265 [Rhodobacteraceae bacterium]|nr:hypothetical protein [Paracoccaceae bacterium]